MDYSFVLLNTLCMPGFFYHFFCLLRSWGLDIDGLTTVSPPSSFMVPEQWLAMLGFNAEVSLSIHPSFNQATQRLNHGPELIFPRLFPLHDVGRWGPGALLFIVRACILLLASRTARGPCSLQMGP